MIDPVLLRLIDDYARRLGKSSDEIIEQAIIEFLENHPIPEEKPIKITIEKPFRF